ncbi:MAG: ankyrin repeat domain-containing protein [Bacteroidales bacterium]|nr:ankyrin repeat domain-containing protein [Bacteroidales bacterium]
MSAKRLILTNLLLVALLLKTISANGQWKFNDPDTEYTALLDTIDYFPPSYTDALNLNLMIAASKGISSEIIRLIKKGADVNAETAEGATPLIFAVSNNKPLAVVTLLAYKPNIDKVTKNDETALLVAVKNRNADLAELLIREGADLDHTDRFGATPLHHASINGYLEIVDLLIYYEADLNSKTTQGTTPLLASIWAGYTEISDLLVQNGAKTEESDNEGYTPYLMATYFGDTIVMDILQKHGANIYATNNSHNNALSLAISTGDTGVAKYLLRKGDQWQNQGKAVNLYSVAAKYRRTEMVNILKNNNIPGKLKREIDQISLSLSSRFFFHDFYTGLNLSFKEPYLNGGFVFGVDTKLWYTRLLIKQTEGQFYQYMDKGSVVYAGFFKDFAFTDYPNSYNWYLSTSLTAGYSIGNNLKGTYISTNEKFKVMPSVSMKISKMNLSYFAGLEYVSTPFYKNGPIWIRLGATYNYFFDNVRTNIKPIKWY